MFAPTLHHQQKADDGLAHPPLGGDSDMRPAPLVDGDLRAQPTRQAPGRAASGLCPDGRVQSVALAGHSDHLDLDRQGLIEARPQLRVAQAKGCRVDQGRRSYDDRNENYKSTWIHPDQPEANSLPTGDLERGLPSAARVAMLRPYDSQAAR